MVISRFARWLCKERRDQTVLGAADININDSFFKICIMQSWLTSFTLYYFMLIIRSAIDTLEGLLVILFGQARSHTREGLPARMLVRTQSFLL